MDIEKVQNLSNKLFDMDSNQWYTSMFPFCSIDHFSRPVVIPEKYVSIYMAGAD